MKRNFAKGDVIHDVISTSLKVMSGLPVFASRTSPIQFNTLLPGFHPYPLIIFGSKLRTPYEWSEMERKRSNDEGEDTLSVHKYRLISTYTFTVSI